MNVTCEKTLPAFRRIIVVVLSFTQWTGTRAMHEKDFTVGANGKLPPKTVARSLGMKAIIDTAHLRVFDNIKHRAEIVLENCGVKYLSGWAIPEEKASKIFRELDALVDRYNAEKAAFLANYDSYVSEWAAANPEFTSRILEAKLPREEVERRIAAGYEPFRVSPVSDEKASALEKSVSGLGNELIANVAQMSRTFFAQSFLGRERASKKTVSAVLKIRERLNGLSFISGAIAPLVAMIDQVVCRVPSEGYFTGEPFWKLATLVQTLGNEELLADIAAGRVTVEGLCPAPMQETSAQAELPALQPTHLELPLGDAPDGNNGKDMAKIDQEPAPATAVSAFEDIDSFFDKEPEDEKAEDGAAETGKTDGSETVATDPRESHQTIPVPHPAQFPQMPAVDVGEGFYF